MSRNTSLQCITELRNLVEAAMQVVWDAEKATPTTGDLWPGAPLANALISHGLLGNTPRTQQLNANLQSGSPFAVEFDYTIHSQHEAEPSTGADLAVVVSVTLDGQQVQRKLFLLHLASATMEKGSVSVATLLGSPGRRAGDEIHPARKMLTISPASVYWLRVPSQALADSAYLQAHARGANLAAHNQARGISYQMRSTDAGLPFLPFSIFDHPSVMMEYLDGYPPYHFIIKRYLIETKQDPQQAITEWCEQYTSERRSELLRAFRHDAGLEAWRGSQCGNHCAVLAVHATSVLALAAQGKTDLASILEMATPLPQFLLGNVICDGFGVEDDQLVEAMTADKVNDHLASIVKAFAGGRTAAALPETIPARAVLRIQLTLNSDYAPRPEHVMDKPALPPRFSFPKAT